MASTRSTPASEAWRALLMAFTGIHHELAAEMEQVVGLPIEHYEILIMLYEAEDAGLRPSEIAQRRRLSRSGATRLIDRLAAAELVERQDCDDDGRGSVVVLTAAGREAFARAGRLHLKGIERCVGSALSPSELAQLQSLLIKLSASGPTPTTES